MTSRTEATTMNTNCFTCLGTGTDTVFGGQCTECFPADTGARFAGLRMAQSEQARTYGNGGGHSGCSHTSTDAAPRTWGWTKFQGAWAALAPVGSTVEAGEVTLVNKAGKESTVTLTGRILSRERYGLVCEMGTAAPAATTTPAVRANRFDGECSRCGQTVPAGEGSLTGQPGAWVTSHLDGACPAAPVAAPQVPAGHYAVPSAGDNDLEFFRVDVTDSGRVYVKLVIGGHPEYNATRKHADRLLAAVVEHGVEASALLYRQELGRCCLCNRALTAKTSRDQAMGPECAKK